MLLLVGAPFEAGQAVELAQAGASAPGVLAQAAPAAVAGAPPAVIRSVNVVGSSLPPEEVEPIRQRFTGAAFNAENGERAAQALRDAYARSDIMLAQVGGPGLGADGVLTLAALEGRLESIDLRGGNAKVRERARSYLDPLLEPGPLKRSAYERAAALVALIPGVTIAPAFDVTPQPGVLRLRMEILAQPWRVDGFVTDRGSLAFGEWQLRGEARAFSVLKGGDQMVLSLGATPDEHEERLIGGTYTVPINKTGLTAVFSAAHVEADAYSSLTPTEGTSALVALAYPLRLRARETLTLTGDIDGQDGQNAAGNIVLSDERTRNMRGALQYSRITQAGEYVVGGVVTVGLPSFGARPAFPGYAPDDYGKFQLYGTLVVPHGDWRLRARATGQATTTRVPFTEQLTLGGDAYGRAFRAVSLQGDQGVAAAVEVARKLRHGEGLLAGSEAFAYLDGGVIDSERRPGFRGGEGHLASVGFGVRFEVSEQAGIELSADHALDYKDPFNATRGRDWRLGVRVHLTYSPLRVLDQAVAALRGGGDGLREDRLSAR